MPSIPPPEAVRPPGPLPDAAEGAPALGIIVLDTRFPRIPGDVGARASWPFPVRFAVARGATPEAAVLRGARRAPPALLEAVIEAGRALTAAGCAGVATTCGFLSVFQDALAAALEVPVASSSLMQARLVAATLPPGRVPGILTVSARSLTAAHLRAADVPPGAPVGGLDPRSAFARTLLEDLPELDREAARAEMIRAARALVAAHPRVGALVLECANMCPYAADVAEATGLPTHSAHDFLTWFHAGLRPPRFRAP
ncbi:hypothetical protein LY05_01116 [Oceanicella actignis]|nr:hypothetical protein LY05_01116 [Oceanicella actignis]